MRPSDTLPQVNVEAQIDRGYGWVVVGGAFIANAISFGILYSFTVFFPAIVREFGQGRGATAVIASVAAAIMLGAGAIIGRLADRFGYSRVIRTGAILVTVGLLLASVSQSIWQVLASYGLILGIGVGCAFLPSNSAVGQWFQVKRGLAIGIAVAGSGVGSVILAPVSQRLIAIYDWRIALRILAALAFVLLLIVSAAVRGRGGRHTSSVLGSMKSDRTFRILYMSAFVASYGYWVPFIHIVPFAQDHNITPGRAALLVSIMGAFNILGRVVLGAMADRLGRRGIFQISVTAMSASVLLWPLAGTFGSLAIFAGAYGFFSGTFISLLFALTADYFGIERLAGVTGLLNTAAMLGTLLGAPLSGLMFDATGTYTLAILIAGGTLAAGSAVLVGLPPVPARAESPIA